MASARSDAVNAAGAERARQLHWLAYGLVLALNAAVWLLYAANLVRWSSSPDFGWRTMYTSGPNVVAQVFGEGAAAGLRSGDRILAINGRRYSSFEELFFGALEFHSSLSSKRPCFKHTPDSGVAFVR